MPCKMKPQKIKTKENDTKFKAQGALTYVILG